MRNLLPERNRRAVKQEYYMRLAVVSGVFVGAALLIAIVALLPAYFEARTKLTAIEEQARLVEESLARRDGNTSLSALRLVNTLLEKVGQEESQAQISVLVRAVLAAKTSPISVSAIHFTAFAAGGELTVEGIAGNRDALLAFRRALEGESRFSSVELPISNLAQTTDIEFILKVTLNEQSS